MHTMNFELDLITDAKKVGHDDLDNDGNVLTFNYAGLSVELLRVMYEWKICLDIRINDIAINYNIEATKDDIELFSYVEKLAHHDERKSHDYHTSIVINKLKTMKMI